MLRVRLYLFDCAQTTNTNFYLYASCLTERPKPSHRLRRRDGILDAVVVAATDARVELRVCYRKQHLTFSTAPLNRLRPTLRIGRRGLYVLGGPASLRRIDSSLRDIGPIRSAIQRGTRRCHHLKWVGSEKSHIVKYLLCFQHIMAFNLIK